MFHFFSAQRIDRHKCLFIKDAFHSLTKGARLALGGNGQLSKVIMLNKKPLGVGLGNKNNFNSAFDKI